MVGRIISSSPWIREAQGHQGCTKIAKNFAEAKLGFYQRIKGEVETWSIPLALIINWDQTGSKLVPVSEWTMEREGSRQVAVVGKEDKREITVLLSVAASGNMLAPQVIYQGKTEGCHAKVTFPEDWNVTRATHWSAELTMQEYIDKVLVPYVTQTRQKLELAMDHPALALFDVFKAHRCDTVLEKLRQNHIHHTSWMHWGAATP